MTSNLANALRMLLLAPLAAALLLVACGGENDDNAPAATSTSPPTVEATELPAATPSPAATESPASGLRFDPAAYICPGAPTPVIEREWQVSAPRQPVAGTDIIDLGLRNKFGEAAESYQATATLQAPDGQVIESASVAVNADNFASLAYPDSFPGAGALQPGTYTVIWEIDGGFVACDGFVVAQ